MLFDILIKIILLILGRYIKINQFQSVRYRLSVVIGFHWLRRKSKIFSLEFQIIKW